VPMRANRNPHHIPTVLVANRGEIAVRVFRTARRMGLRCAAVYSEADAGAPFVRMADAAWCIGPAPAAQSYLRAEKILEAAKALRADLIHPGFGFLSEDAAFGRAVEDAGYAFVGPPPDVLAAMGGKDEAKRIAQAAGVPTLPGYGGDDQADAFGNVIHLGERDCSLQRRHQKILEETPSPSVTVELRDQLTSAAVALARHVGYRNAGTCEFLVEDGGPSEGGGSRVFGFIEM